MAKYTGPKGKLVRRFGSNIVESQKMERLLERRNYPPGQHGQSSQRRKLSQYGLQLLEKQKLKCTYGLLEKQFHRTFRRAHSLKGVTGDNLLMLLEGRLDNAVFRAGFSQTRMQARQLINHGHVQVNGRRVDIPSFQVRAGDLVSPGRTARSQQLLVHCQAESDLALECSWLAVDRDQLQFRVKHLPQREEIRTEINEKLIVELYSK